MELLTAVVVLITSSVKFVDVVFSGGTVRLFTAGVSVRGVENLAAVGCVEFEVVVGLDAVEGVVVSAVSAEA